MQIYPKISIIIPCYNCEKYIDECLTSIVNQNYPNLELIVVDGGSSDATLTIINKFQKYIQRIISEPDKGQTDALNKGIKNCTGDLFYWINADDYLENDVFVKLANCYAKNEADIVLVKNRAFFDSDGLTRNYFGATIKNTIEETITDGGMSITLFYNLEKAKTLFPLSMDLHYAMDFEFLFRFILKYGVDNVYTAEDISCFTHFRIHEDSKTFIQSDIGYSDLNAMYLTMLKQLNAPDFILKYYEGQVLTNAYSNKWDFTNVDKSKLLAYFARKASVEYYTKKEYDLALQCLFFLNENGVEMRVEDKKRWRRMRFIPTIILNFLRR